MLDGAEPVTRLRIADEALGWTKLTEAPCPTEKPCQLTTAFWLDCVTFICVAEGCAIVTLPAATLPWVGRFCAEAETIIAAYARACNLMGAPGSGQLAKMVNQICIAGVVQGLAEALHFAQKADLDIEKLVATISKGAAQSWQMENRYKTMAAGKFDFGFAVDWMRKDLAICLAEARRNGASLPLTALVDQFYAQVQKMGGRRWDTSSLIALLQR